jgi:CheY-like chemotaxis protein
METKMKTILIVDDQPEMTRLLEIVLRGEGRQLLFANNGEEGFAVARSSAPDLILLDLMMPGAVDGYEAARRLKKDAATAGAHILVMSAKVLEQSRRDAFAAGADDFISKPFDVFDLKSRVDRLLS